MSKTYPSQLDNAWQHRTSPGRIHQACPDSVTNETDKKVNHQPQTAKSISPTVISSQSLSTGHIRIATSYRRHHHQLPPMGTMNLVREMRFIETRTGIPEVLILFLENVNQSRTRGMGKACGCELQRPEWRRSRWSLVLQKTPREGVLDLQGKGAGQDDQSLYEVLEDHLDLILGETVSAHMRPTDQRRKFNEFGPGTIILAPLITKSLTFHHVIPTALLILQLRTAQNATYPTWHQSQVLPCPYHEKGRNRSLLTPVSDDRFLPSDACMSSKLCEHVDWLEALQSCEQHFDELLSENVVELFIPFANNCSRRSILIATIKTPFTTLSSIHQFFLTIDLFRQIDWMNERLPGATHVPKSRMMICTPTVTKICTYSEHTSGNQPMAGCTNWCDSIKRTFTSCAPAQQQQCALKATTMTSSTTGEAFLDDGFLELVKVQATKTDIGFLFTPSNLPRLLHRGRRQERSLL
ncbi:uncharacterized protein FTJAE_5689 [Fusarium tjaetaba]|uniref:Uncharacterized protein n=1 Tax=Fusarium tjaetaba TaxID=1567544 RepID=A0A8H5RQC7_9HYPO|nr:uncharacterized protein FTJAE_5689 [Fusarium tjaetaba]KAF5637274.1 hypothetical protein FTJAE_5689 [Fusarium tjaetaba]